jgi:hypothetical protein
MLRIIRTVMTMILTSVIALSSLLGRLKAILVASDGCVNGPVGPSHRSNLRVRLANHEPGETGLAAENSEASLAFLIKRVRK